MLKLLEKHVPDYSERQKALKTAMSSSRAGSVARSADDQDEAKTTTTKQAGSSKDSAVKEKKRRRDLVKEFQ